MREDMLCSSQRRSRLLSSNIYWPQTLSLSLQETRKRPINYEIFLLGFAFLKFQWPASTSLFEKAACAGYSEANHGSNFPREFWELNERNSLEFDSGHFTVTQLDFWSFCSAQIVDRGRKLKPFVCNFTTILKIWINKFFTFCDTSIKSIRWKQFEDEVLNDHQEQDESSARPLRILSSPRRRQVQSKTPQWK